MAQAFMHSHSPTHPNAHMHTLLTQIDIEGFEYEVFADMTEADDATLPRQVGGLAHQLESISGKRPAALIDRKSVV